MKIFLRKNINKIKDIVLIRFKIIHKLLIYHLIMEDL